MNTYSNGVRTGNIPDHKSKLKRSGTGQSWFPSTWDTQAIRDAGASVHRNQAKPGNVGPYFDTVNNVRVGIFTDPVTGKVSTIFPDAGHQPSCSS